MCYVCGGSEFVLEAGFYYCVECQTQVKDVREQEYEHDQTLANTRTTRTTISRGSEATGSTGGSKRARLASWEVYNYVLAGLCRELVELGAPAETTEMTRLLWLEYLRRLGVLCAEGEKPRIGLAGRRRDAAIVYGRAKRHTPATSSTCTGGDDDRAVRRERAKRRRKLVHAEYERDAARTGADSRSLADATLSEVSSGGKDSDGSEEPSRPRYTAAANKAMRAGRRMRTHSYWNSAWAPSRDRLYALLCLGVQLAYGAGGRQCWLPGDVLRACRDGHLSYLSYTHMIPPECARDCLVSTLRGLAGPPTHHGIRKNMGQLARLLRIKVTLFAPDIQQIVNRYTD